MKVFGKYANYYDLLYKDKNYTSECEMIKSILNKYSKKKVGSILDLGCGTGNHSIILQSMGYKIVGVDISQTMLENAIKKIDEKNSKLIKFEHGDIKTWRTKETFDAVIMMFAVLGYQISNEDVVSALQNVRRHIKKGGIFIFDVWFGPSVVSQKPSTRTKKINTEAGKLTRKASSQLHITENTVTVHYETNLEKNGRVLASVEEDHDMRYFFPKELDMFIQTTGFELVHSGSFPKWKNPPNESSWNAIWIVRAV